MTEQKRIIAPRQPTPSSRARDTGRLTNRLPDDVLAEQVQRFALFTAVGGGLWTMGLLVDTVLRPLTIGPTVPGPPSSSKSAGIAFSVFMFLYVRYCKRTPQGKIDLGLAYMLANAAGIALLNTWVDRSDDRDAEASVVDHGRHPDHVDDHAEHAEQDAGGVAGGGLDGSARRLDRAPARLPGAVAAQHARPVPAQLFLRRRRRRAGALSAAPGPAAARGARIWAATG